MPYLESALVTSAARKTSAKVPALMSKCLPVRQRGYNRHDAKKATYHNKTSEIDGWNMAS